MKMNEAKKGMLQFHGSIEDENLHIKFYIESNENISWLAVGDELNFARVPKPKKCGDFMEEDRFFHNGEKIE